MEKPSSSKPLMVMALIFPYSLRCSLPSEASVSSAICPLHVWCIDSRLASKQAAARLGALPDPHLHRILGHLTVQVVEDILSIVRPILLPAKATCGLRTQPHILQDLALHPLLAVQSLFASQDALLSFSGFFSAFFPFAFASFLRPNMLFTAKETACGSC